MKQVVTITLNPAIDKTVSVRKFEVDQLNRVESEDDIQIDPGGKGINVAKVLTNFRVDVTASGFIGGKQGRQLLTGLDEKQIKHSFTMVKGETRTNLKIVDIESNSLTELNEPGFTVSEEEVDQLFEHLTILLPTTSILVLGGSYPKGVDKDIYKRIIEFANKQGVKVILDADGDAFKEGIEAGPYAVKPNVFELELLYNQKLSTMDEIVEAGKKLLGKGISTVVISMGKDGAVVLNDQSEVYRVEALSIVPGSTVGAGDSMVAAMVYCTLNEMPLQSLARWATAAGGMTASKPGTEVCTFDEVQEAKDQVKVYKI
ncbi:1-phosphofructokinase [Litchfieldia salsa]|uniref:Tagatose-6-phosphate kinase n=1 Tax=Litchfieldia salsa TaxID=930152 RepID=A0A1H0X279_9BACI|nr:1-phosphofructokinase [Litchfieldia salsa]SDP96939.1 fructose-1-phosphate kinase [Litchfieldia salsa]